LRKTIIHITESLARGGTETLLVGVVQSLKQYEHIIISLRERNDFTGELKDVKIYYLDLKGYGSIPSLVNKVKKLVQPFRDHAIVHAHMFWANIISRLAIPKNIPLLNSYHSVSYGPDGANYPLHAILLDRFTYSKRVKTLCVSCEVQKNVQQYIGIKENISILYNYIDDLFYKSDHLPLYLPSDHLKMIAVGNLKHQKNYETIIAAFGLLKTNNKEEQYSLDIYGRGPLQESLEQQVKKLNVNNIHFMGAVPDIANRLPQYDLYLLSSTYEGFGIAVVEAMAIGLPIIVSDIEVLQEVTGGNAVFFNPNKPEELAHKIQEVINGKIDLKDLALRGKEKAEEYRKVNYMRKLEDIYQSFFK
jgi:glycosyltransferase involved in cell wall biosynthesis